jgi:hypothetical protein
VLVSVVVITTTRGKKPATETAVAEVSFGAGE